MALAAGWWWEHQKQYRRVSDLSLSILPTKRRKVHSTEVKRKQSNLNVFSGGYYLPSCCIFETIKEEPLSFFLTFVPICYFNDGCSCYTEFH